MTTRRISSPSRFDRRSPAARARLLIVESDSTVRQMLLEDLSFAGFDVETVDDGRDALTYTHHRDYDLIVLDLEPRSLSGLEVMRTLRAEGSTVPIIILSPLLDEDDMIHGYELGADHYITRPFSPRELTARIRASLRRRALDRNQPQTIERGAISIDLMRQHVVVDGTDVHLTPAEMRILMLLVDRAGGVVSRQEIVHDIWGSATYDPRAAYVHIFNLRKKIEVDPAHPRRVVTVPGLGYRLGDG